MDEVSVDLRKVIRGALLTMIYDHGPITRDNVDSAAKRVNGAIRSAVKDQAMRQMAAEAAERLDQPPDQFVKTR